MIAMAGFPERLRARRAYAAAFALLGAGGAAILLAAFGVAARDLILVAAPATPIAIGCILAGRMARPVPWRAPLLGAVVGTGIGLVVEPLAAGFVLLFVQGFAGSGQRLITSLQLDPRLVTVLASPWVLVLLVELVAVAPLTEEAGKALGARLARPRSREEAFYFGAWAGVGFALVENLLYAGIGATAGGGWPLVALSRSLGAAVHPLATGLVMLGWWQWRDSRRPLDLARGYLSGAGIHALWNGTLVTLGVVVAAWSVGTIGTGLQYLSLVYGGVLGVAMAAALWVVAGNVAGGRDPLMGRTLRSARPVAMLTVLGASLLVPLAILVVAFPNFYRG
jgi:RsiW-degrading membrane proteinase PrsW (M82 family)